MLKTFASAIAVTAVLAASAPTHAGIGPGNDLSTNGTMLKDLTLGNSEASFR